MEKMREKSMQYAEHFTFSYKSVVPSSKGFHCHRNPNSKLKQVMVVSVYFTD